MQGQTAVRRTVSLPHKLAARVQALARQRRISANRLILELLERGIESQEGEKERFFALADALVSAKSAEERSRLKKELAKMTFGR